MGGAVTAWRVVVRWESVKRARRLNEPLPPPRVLATLAGGVIVLAALMGVLRVFELPRR